MTTRIAKSGSKYERAELDTEHGLIGGVCAGIAAYFGINPLWVRLIAIISPFMSFGTAVLVYVVLWLSIPEARTASDKLRMRGEPITLDSLKQLTIDDNTKIQVRIFSSDSGKMEPDLVTNPFDAGFFFTAAEEQEIYRLKQENKLDEAFRLLFIK